MRSKNNRKKESQLLGLARELINTQTTMALATAVQDEPWAAPVYYVFEQGGFYFFSAPDSRHILQALESGKASAAIYPFVSSWQEIRGIQMSGRIQKVRQGIRGMQALWAYIDKYPFVREFFNPGQTFDLEAFRKRFRVRFYCFLPDFVYYMDNSISFGFRELVKL